MNELNGMRVNVGDILDSTRFRGLPLLVMACAAVVMILDGFDIQVIGFAAPALATEWGISRAALAPAGRIDALLIISLTFMLWFCIVPLIAMWLAR